MREIEVTKTMYETIDGQLFETKEKADEHELILKCHKAAISFAERIQKMCEEYAHYNDNDNDECDPKCPFKSVVNGCCKLDDYPCNWCLPTL